MAERGGFEPPIGYEPIHAFQACDLNHSSISPAMDYCEAMHSSIKMGDVLIFMQFFDKITTIS